MPELPEVETVCRKLKPHILNKKIERLTIRYPGIIRTPEVEAFQLNAAHNTFTNVTRNGKHIIFHLSDYKIVSHLRMEGKFNIVSTDTPFDKHDHIIFHLSDERDLRYNDVRKFGTMDLVKDEYEIKAIKALGPEPNSKDLTLSHLKTHLAKKKTSIKNALLDQSIISGLGNIYVDEVLYQSSVHPTRLANTVLDKELTNIIKATNGIIERAIERGGSSIRSYNSLGEEGNMQSLHRVYGKKGEPCPSCLTLIEKIKVNGRGTHFCPTCQK